MGGRGYEIQIPFHREAHGGPSRLSADLASPGLCNLVPRRCMLKSTGGCLLALWPGYVPPPS